VPVPVALLRLGARAAGFGPELDRLTESLCVDGSRIRAELAWAPPETLDRGLARTVAA
jgi:UDP-glucose 4-epimerase